ncbi:SGNH/GDSL hydrolase family protein [Minwuia sp.]|uniref:SGNH/GDSL hydrolase family protein n=1 Tax=Minwuia sp. TaxID=2493630 RepID=UPI003A8D8A74
MATITEKRNKINDTAPAIASHVLVLGDSIGRDFRFGVSGGAMLDQIAAISSITGETALVNAAFGGYKLMDQSGDDRFLNFADLAEANGLTAAKTIMGNFPPVDGVVISLGANDLGNVETAPNAISGYDAGKVRAGLDRLIAEIRAENITNGYSDGVLPVVLLVPGRDRSTGGKRGGSQTWREGSIAAAAADSHVRLLDYYDVDLEDSVHPSAAGAQTVGWRAGRLIASMMEDIDFADGGPPSITSIARIDDQTIRVNFNVPSGQQLIQPAFPTSWRVENADTQSELQIARLDWIDSNEANLILAEGSSAHFRLFAPHDLVERFAPEGVIRTLEDSNDHAPGFVLQSFAGSTA